MFQSQQRIQIGLVSAIFLCLLIGIYLVAVRRLGKGNSSATVVKHTVETPADDVLKYWTAERMREAKPAEMPNVTNLKRKKPNVRHSPHQSGPQQD